jgi:hypothetical protein
MGGIECLLLIPFIIHFKILDKGGKWTFYYLVASLIFAAGSFLVGYVWKNNMWFFSIMYFIQFVILSRFFHIGIKNETIKRLIKLTLIPVFIIFLADFLKLEGLFTYNSYFATARSFIILLYGIIFFWQLLRDEELVKKSIFINSLPDFWYNAGLFIYHSGSFMFFLAYNMFSQVKTHELYNARIITLGISYVAGIIQLILLYIGLEKAKKMRNERL